MLSCNGGDGGVRSWCTPNAKARNGAKRALASSVSARRTATDCSPSLFCLIQCFDVWRLLCCGPCSGTLQDKNVSEQSRQHTTAEQWAFSLSTTSLTNGHSAVSICPGPAFGSAVRWGSIQNLSVRTPLLDRGRFFPAIGNRQKSHLGVRAGGSRRQLDASAETIRQMLSACARLPQVTCARSRLAAMSLGTEMRPSVRQVSQLRVLA